jgi:hypothetical protein
MHVSVSSVKELCMDTARMYAYECVYLLLQLGIHAIDCILCLCTYTDINSKTPKNYTHLSNNLGG